MKKLFVILATVLFAVAMTSCKSCSKPDEPKGWNYDEVVKADYDYIASQYSPFYFYEVDVLFDTILPCREAYVESIRTVFQYEDTCPENSFVIFIEHNADMTTDTIIEKGYWLECMNMSAYNAVSFDSCMNIIEPYRDTLLTRAMTFRRVLAPPFPENGQYIFGVGILVVDSKTGQIVDWNSEKSTEGRFAVKPLDEPKPIVDVIMVEECEEE